MAKKKVNLNNEIERLLSPEVRKELDKAPPSPAFQQFLIRYLDLRDSVIINFIADNDAFAENIAKKVREDVAESYLQLAVVLKEIQQSQLTTSNNIAKIFERLDVAEEKVKAEEVTLLDHEGRLREKKRRIKELEDKWVEHDRITNTLALVEPTLIRIQNTFNWWTVKKTIIIILTIIALFVSLVVGIVVFMHKNKYVASDDKQSYSKDWTVERKNQMINAPVRGIHSPVVGGTKQDSTNDAIIDQDEKDIMAGIEARNREYEKKYSNKKGSQNGQ